MILHKQLIIALSFALLTTSCLSANDNVISLLPERTTQQKAGAVVKEGTLAAVCFFFASFIMKGLVPPQYEQIASMLLGGTATLAVNHKTVKKAVTHPVESAKDPETAGKVVAMIIGGAAGNYGASYTPGAKVTFENLAKGSGNGSKI